MYYTYTIHFSEPATDCDQFIFYCGKSTCCMVAPENGAFEKYHICTIKTHSREFSSQVSFMDHRHKENLTLIQLMHKANKEETYNNRNNRNPLLTNKKRVKRCHDISKSR